jgi:taurine transport system substrate-binding protein
VVTEGEEDAIGAGEMRRASAAYRRPTGVLLFALLLTVWLTGCGSTQGGGGGGGSGQPDSVTIGYQVIPNAALVAKQRGMVEEAVGAPVEWLEFDSGASVITAMTSGSIDIALAGTTAASTAIASDLPIQVIGIHDVIAESEAMVAKESSGISGLADLRGQTVAVPFGSTTHFALLQALSDQQIPQGDVEILDLQPQEMVAAWGSGNIDAGYVWQPSLGEMVNDGGQIVLTSKDLLDRGIVTADLILAREEFVDEYPDAATGYAQAISDAVEFYRSSPDEATAAVAEETGLEPDVVQEQMNGLIWLNAEEHLAPEYMGTPEEVGDLADTLKNTGDFMMNQEQIPSSPELEVYRGKVNPTFFSEVAQQ